MSNVLGKLLQELLQKEGSPSVKDFAKMMGLSSRTLYNIYDGSSSMTFDQVVKASEILNFDLADEYYHRSGKSKVDQVSDSNSTYATKQNKVAVTITVCGAIATYQKFPDLLIKIRDDARKMGFDIN